MTDSDYSERNGSKRQHLYQEATAKEDAKENRYQISYKSSEKKRMKTSDNKLATQTELAEKIENTIMNYGRKIKSVEEEVVDLDDPNSAFIRSEKMKTRLVRFVSKCYDEKDIKPMYVVYKKIKITPEIVPFPTLVKTVEKFINTSCIQYGERNIPNYKEIRAVVEKWNTSNEILTENDVNYYSGKIMELIISDIRKKRRKDLDAVLNKYVEVENRDPAEVDPILAEKFIRNQEFKMKIVETSFMNGEKIQFNPSLGSNSASKLEEPIVKTEPL